MAHRAGERHHGEHSDARRAEVPGKQTLVERIATPAIQRRGEAAGGDPAKVQAAAARGVATAASPLPYADRIQRLFGRHDISGVQAHAGPEAAASAHAMGAQAYATGAHVVLGGATDLHTVAHEAAHVVQQRGGVQLKGGVGEAGDAYERHADQVADAVVAGRSAEGLLDQMTGAGAAGGAGQGPVQRYIELGKPHAPSPEENDEDPVGKIRHRDGTFAAFDRKVWNTGMAYRAYHYEAYFGLEEDQGGRIGKWLAEDMGVELHDGPAVHAVLYAMELSGLPLEDFTATTSGGSSLTLFPKGKDYVVQYFRAGAFASVKLMYEALKLAKPELKKHVAEIKQINDALQVAVMEKITPLNAIFDFFGHRPELQSVDALKIYVREHAKELQSAGLTAVLGLAELGVSQGDVSLDNMGLKNGEFALFDYDKARTSSEHTVSHDQQALETSITKRGEIKK